MFTENSAAAGPSEQACEILSPSRLAGGEIFVGIALGDAIRANSRQPSRALHSRSRRAEDIYILIGAVT